MVINRKKKRRVMFRRKRSLDPSINIDYKDPEQLKRFVTDRGKVIPRRISGATAAQQRHICKSVKRARYLALLPFSIAHRTEKKMFIDVALAAAAGSFRPRPPRDDQAPRPPRDDSSGSTNS